MERARFTLPEICGCGARGTVTFEGEPSGPEEAHPQLKVVEVDGPFRLDAEGEIVCLSCEELANGEEA